MTHQQLATLIVDYNELTKVIDKLCTQGHDPAEMLLTAQDSYWKRIITQLQEDYNDPELVVQALNDLGIARYEGKGDPRSDPYYIGNCPF